MDDEDESKGFRQPKRWGEGGEELFAAKKLKKDLTKFTPSPSPSPSPAGERVHALTKQTPVRKDFTQSTSSPTGGEKVHAFIKQTLGANSQQIFRANSRQILANNQQILETNGQQKANSRQTLEANSQQILANSQQIWANSQQFLEANSQQILEANGLQTLANSQQKANNRQNLANSQQILANGQQVLEANGPQKANSRQKGKNVASTEEASIGPIYTDVCTETSSRPFVKSWYNNELEKRDRETWVKFDGLFKAIQTSNNKTANFWLSQLEKSHLSREKKLGEMHQLVSKLGEVHQLVSRLVSFSSTSRSEWLETKEKYLFSETSSEEQRNLKSIFSRLRTADLVNLRIEDFLELLNTLEVREDGVEELESKAKVQDMISLYQQHLIDDNRLLVFFQQLEDAKKKKT